MIKKHNSPFFFNIVKGFLVTLWVLPFIYIIIHYIFSYHYPYNSVILKLLFFTSFISIIFLFLDWLLDLRSIIYFHKAFRYLSSQNLIKLDKILEKIPISQCYSNGITLLKYAVDSQMNTNIITFLLSKGALVTYSNNKEYNTSYTLFYLASYYNFLNENLVNFLLNKGAYIDFIDNSRGIKSLSILQVFVLRCHRDIVKLLLDKGADVHYTIPDIDMNTLMLAAKYINNIEIISMLVKNGNNINAANNINYTPILFAAEYNPSPEVIYALYELGASIEPRKIKSNMLRINSVTPLRLAVVNNNIDVINALIRIGDNVNYKDLYGFSILFIAASHNTDLKVIKLLLKSGARLDQANDSEGNIPLMGAAYLNSNIDVILYFIKISDNIDKRNDDGLTFIDYLKENNSIKSEDKEHILKHLSYY